MSSDRKNRVACSIDGKVLPLGGNRFDFLDFGGFRFWWFFSRLYLPVVDHFTLKH